MRHKYDTRGIVLARTSAGEANAFITILTPELGLLRARAQGLRKSGAKLSSSLVTFAESDFVLVHGREGWRVAGAVLQENWFTRIQNGSARDCSARVSGLLLRLVAGEECNATLFFIITSFFKALAEFPDEDHDAIELLTVLRILATLGLDNGKMLGEETIITESILSGIMKERTKYVARINHGITASGL